MKAYHLVAVVLALVVAPLRSQDMVFTEIAGPAGVSLPNTLNESVAWGDYDLDGDEDLYLTNDGPNRLFRNDGGDVFTDVTASAGVGNDQFSVGAAFGDLDNDGDLDLYVVNFSSGPDVLYRNNGNGTFSDITAQAGINDSSSSRGLTLLDYDRDGLLDIYVNAIGPDILYHNLGNLSFENVSNLLGPNASGLGVGVVATDLNADGWIDIFNGNRSEEFSNLWINENGTLRDVAQQAGVVKRGLGMGVLAMDYNNDLNMDLYWTTWPGESGNVANALYRNEGNLQFVDVAEETGTANVTGWGISCNAGDLDNDGWIDFFVTNGFSADSSANVLFRNQWGQSFEDVTHVLGGGLFDGRGVAFADYDRDGDLDLCVTGGPESVTRLWRNDTPSGSHFITFQLEGRVGNASAIGARILVTAGGMTQVREVSGGAGRGSFNSLLVSFGLGEACLVEKVQVFWPGGGQSTYENMNGDRIIRLVEPTALDSGSYSVVDHVVRGSCLSCNTPLSVTPWVVNNTQWNSRIAIFNAGDQSARVCLRALDRVGETLDFSVSVPSNAVYSANSEDLFPGMSGYSLFVSASSGQVHTSFLTFNKESASGNSPSQTTSPLLSQLTSKLLFGYVSGTDHSAVVITAPSTSEDETVVKMELFGDTGLVLAEQNVTLIGNRPTALLISDLFQGVALPEHGAVKASSENGELLAGTTFVFNLFREPSMSRAFSL